MSTALVQLAVLDTGTVDWGYWDYDPAHQHTAADGYAKTAHSDESANDFMPDGTWSTSTMTVLGYPIAYLDAGTDLLGGWFKQYYQATEILGVVAYPTGIAAPVNFVDSDHGEIGGDEYGDGELGDWAGVVISQGGSPPITVALTTGIDAPPDDTANQGTLGQGGLGSFGLGNVTIIGPTVLLATNQNVGPTGAESAEAFGTAHANTLSSVAPSAIDSAEAFGTSIVSQDTIVTGIPSAEAFGLASCAQLQTLLPSAIASAVALGLPNVVGPPQFVLARGFNSGRWAFPTVVGGSQVLTLWVSGIPIYAKAESIDITKTGNNRGTCRIVIEDPTNAYANVLTVGRTVRINESGRCEFAGVIADVDEYVHESTTAHVYELSCVDFAAALDRLVYTADYPIASLGYNVVMDIVQNKLAAEGITGNHVDGFWVVYGSMLSYRFKKVTEILNELAKYNANGEGWFIDEHKDLHFHNATSATAGGGAPIPILESSPQFRQLRIKRTNRNYRNVQYVRVNKNLGFSSRSETVIASAPPLGGGTMIPTKFPITSYPTVKVNGVDVGTVRELLSDPGAYAGGWYWIRNGIGIFNFASPLSGGQSVEIIYNSFAVNVVVVEDEVEIAARAAAEGGSGRYENVYEAKDATEDQAIAIATGLLRMHSGAGVPEYISYQTDYPIYIPGRLQTVTLPEFNILGVPFLITQINSKLRNNDLGYGSSFTRNVQLGSNEADGEGESFKWFEQLAERTNQGSVDPQHEKATLIVTGGAIDVKSHAGPPYQVKRAGLITRATISVRTPPVGDLIRVDVLLNGVSIFKENQLLEIRTSDSGDVIYERGALESTNLRVEVDDIITFDITNTDDGTARDLSVVVTMDTPN